MGLFSRTEGVEIRASGGEDPDCAHVSVRRPERAARHRPRPVRADFECFPQSAPFPVLDVNLRFHSAFAPSIHNQFFAESELGMITIRLMVSATR